MNIVTPGLNIDQDASNFEKKQDQEFIKLVRTNIKLNFKKNIENDIKEMKEKDMKRLKDRADYGGLILLSTKVKDTK